MENVRKSLLLISLTSWLFISTGCGNSTPPEQSSSKPVKHSSDKAGRQPNILFVVWDTVRSDYLSLQGYQRPTTPRLEKWSRQARVFTDCIAVGSTTVPTHVSMFTGLLPDEHGATNLTQRIGDQLWMLAEIFKAADYHTYMFSENPKVSDRNNLAQGFDLVEHPWSPRYCDEALRIALKKVPPTDRSTNLTQLLRQENVRGSSVKTAGELAQKGVLAWLGGLDDQRPYFIFLNYLEAHYPLIPPVEYRRRLMTAVQVAASYRVDRTAWTFWSYIFRRHEYTEAELELTRLTYAAAVLELDDLFHNLLTALSADGYLDDTIVVLVSDHGEHLGEHHLLDHQYSVYEPLLRVPLVLYDPARVAPGRDSSPVTNMDIFPTLLELAGLPSAADTQAVSLLHPAGRRGRMGVYAGVVTKRFDAMRRYYPGFDASEWDRALRAYYDGPYKLIEASNGTHELYQLERDPQENRNTIARQPEVARRLQADLSGLLGRLRQPAFEPATPLPPVDEEHLRRLRLLGYLDEEDTP